MNSERESRGEVFSILARRCRRCGGLLTSAQGLQQLLPAKRAQRAKEPAGGPRPAAFGSRETGMKYSGETENQTKPILFHTPRVKALPKGRRAPFFPSNRRGGGRF